MQHIYFTFLLLLLTISSCQNVQLQKNIQREEVLNLTPKSIKIDSIRFVVIDSVVCPLKFSEVNITSNQIGFESVVAHTLRAKLIPSNGQRKESKITGILGVTHFFLDHDLSVGYVHHNTLTFYKQLRRDDFVMKFDKIAQGSNEGSIYYIKKKDTLKTDKLGQDIAFFRQWKLSEIDYRESNGKIEINVKPCSYWSGEVCPQRKAGTTNPFGPEIQFWQQFNRTGYLSLDNFTKLDNLNGGTVVIIWEEKNSGQILFQDIHGSLYEIINRAIEISKKYQTDPSIAISDAGPMANKFRSNEMNELDCSKFPLPTVPYAGAGFGYIPQKIYTIFDKKENKILFKISP